MDVLIRYGFSIEEINIMMNSNEEINNISDQCISELIKILEEFHCSVDQIKNIFITNPFVLTRDLSEIKKLTVKLLDIGILNLNYLFDSNPFILNVDYKDIDSIVKGLNKEHYSDKQIIDYFYYHSYEMI